ncbi:DUF2970 domain-containing protein [Lacisediminimonas sp.]|uniref:DUF2970 domain-containing protein n=1 Tax=Lacisediminimonas sp. TaxID=3060582 RepID=UPI002724F370|nr:DUF2970 domain-containing protein [Lacisediminimonas sp.]MDO8301423.1 DUF2970 domain-containing protein [Lacisediminimonas sp.]
MKTENAKKPDTRSFLSTLAAIAWSFAGLRRRKDFEQDVGRMNPFYVLAAAAIGLAIFICALLIIVNYAVS